MTLRELLKALHVVDDKYLDENVFVSPTSGGYEDISQQQAGDVPPAKIR